jgi:hypothetical protein
MNTPFSRRGRHVAGPGKPDGRREHPADGMLPAPAEEETPRGQLNAAMTADLPGAVPELPRRVTPVYLSPIGPDGSLGARMPLTGAMKGVIRTRPDGSVVAGVILGQNKNLRYVVEYSTDAQLDAALAALMQAKDARAGELALRAEAAEFTPSGRTVEVDGLADAGEVHG